MTDHHHEHEHNHGHEHNQHDMNQAILSIGEQACASYHALEEAMGGYISIVMGTTDPSVVAGITPDDPRVQLALPMMLSMAQAEMAHAMLHNLEVISHNIDLIAMTQRAALEQTEHPRMTVNVGSDGRNSSLLGPLDGIIAFVNDGLRDRGMTQHLFDRRGTCTLCGRNVQDILNAEPIGCEPITDAEVIPEPEIIPHNFDYVNERCRRCHSTIENATRAASHLCDGNLIHSDLCDGIHADANPYRCNSSNIF